MSNDINPCDAAWSAALGTMAKLLWPKEFVGAPSIVVMEIVGEPKSWAVIDFDMPVIIVDWELPIAAVPEILAHELAHWNAGEAARHGQEWRAMFRSLAQKAGLDPDRLAIPTDDEE